MHLGLPNYLDDEKQLKCSLSMIRKWSMVNVKWSIYLDVHSQIFDNKFPTEFVVSFKIAHRTLFFFVSHLFLISQFIKQTTKAIHFVEGFIEIKIDVRNTAYMFSNTMSEGLP